MWLEAIGNVRKILSTQKKLLLRVSYNAIIVIIFLWKITSPLGEQPPYTTRSRSGRRNPINVQLSSKMDLYQDGVTKNSDLLKSKSASYRYFVVILGDHMDSCIRLDTDILFLYSRWVDIY